MILSLLRERTANLHARIEQTLDLPTHLRSVTTYTSLLARFHGFYAPLEDRLAVVGSTGLNLAARQKAHLLRQDLIHLGLEEAAIDTLPRCHNLPSVRYVAEAFGCLYVLEGATLGGQIVRKQAEKAIVVSPGRGCSFFASYGRSVGRMWHEFCQSLETYAVANPSASDRIVTAAADTFMGLEQWLTEGIT